MRPLVDITILRTLVSFGVDWSGAPWAVVLGFYGFVFLGPVPAKIKDLYTKG
jgi:hypothetical protein